jgi:uncharacterized protein YraI
MRRRALVLLVAALVAPSLGAQKAVATAGVNVRSGQSKSSQILDHLATGDTVTLLSPSQRKGYYHIEESDGTKGWVYVRYLELVGSAPTTTTTGAGSTTSSTGTGSTTSSTDTASTTSVTPSGTTAGAAVSKVSASWAKPAFVTSVFNRAGFGSCARGGDGGDTATNVRKNRTDEPSAYHLVSFDAILGLPYPKNHKPQRSGWSLSDLQVIAPVEGIAVQFTGFIASQRGIIVEDAQNGSSGESTNCHATDDPGVDWHMTIVKGKNDPKSAGIVVETTPRVRQNGHPWTPAMLAAAVTNRDSVRISGWLMYDPEHFAQTTNYDPAQPSNAPTVRATLWEIHPITKIEVFDPTTGKWRAIP